MSTETMEKYDFIEVTVNNQVALVNLNHPPLNILTDKIMKDMNAILDELDRNRDVHALVLSSEGTKTFTAGVSIDQMNAADPIGIQEFNRKFRDFARSIEKVSKPVIAAITGLCLGGGIEFSLACDFRICSDQTKFAFPEIGLGIIPGGGGTQRLPRLIGKNYAKEMIYFGEMIDAQKALDIQLVNKVVPTEEVVAAAIEWAEKLAKKPPISLRMAKEVIEEGMQVDLDTGLMLETKAFGVVHATEDRREGMNAFKEKRKPIFTGK